MNMQQMLAQAQKMQRELKKAKAAFYEQEFTKTQNGLVTITMYGNRKIKSLSIEEDALEPSNKEMIEDAIIACISALTDELNEKEDAIEESITGSHGGIF